MTAKARYDGGGDWKDRLYVEAEWEAISKRVREKLRPFYPDKNARAEPPFAHPADEWANSLLDEADSVLSTTLRLRLRLTNEELRAEQTDVLKVLKKAEWCLSNLSLDFDIMLGVDADIRGCRDQIRALIPRVEATEAIISNQPQAKRRQVAEHEAAVEMAVRVLRVLKQYGIEPSATADTDLGYISDAVKILKIIGDEIGLELVETTWKSIIIEAKPSLPIRQ